MSFVGSLAGGCSPSQADPEPPPLVCFDAGIDVSSCTNAYAPTYDAIYENTLKPSCAKTGVSCHGGGGHQGDVNFDTPDNGYSGLLNGYKVRAGQPSCSVLVQRIIAKDGKIRMPPGRSLDAGEECAISQWIAQGAKR